MCAPPSVGSGCTGSFGRGFYHIRGADDATEHGQLAEYMTDYFEKTTNQSYTDQGEALSLNQLVSFGMFGM